MKKIASLSAAIQLLNIFTEKTNTTGWLDFRINKKVVIPIVKNHNYHVLTNLFHGSYKLSVYSEYYYPVLNQIITVTTEANLEKSLYKLFLIPRPSYPYADIATLVRGIVIEANKPARLLDGVKVTAIFTKGVNSKTIETITDNRVPYVGHYAIQLVGVHDPEVEIKVNYSKEGYLPVSADFKVFNEKTTVFTPIELKKI